MDYNQIKAAIDLLQDTANRLQQMVETTSSDKTSNQTVYEAKEGVKKAIAYMSAAINPPIPDRIPSSLLEKAEALGIPLDDVEVRVAIASHHPSQVAGVLEEIDNRAEDIKRRREYFLVRLPDIRVEQLGSRVPYVTAADFDWSKEVIPQDVRDAIRAKYNIPHLTKKKLKNRSSLFAKIEEAKAALETHNAAVSLDESDEELPF